MAPTRTGDFKPDTYKRLTALTKSRFAAIKTVVEELQSHPETITRVQRKSLKVYANEINRKHEDFLQHFLRATSYHEEDAISEEVLAEDQNNISDSYVYLASVIEDLLGEDKQHEHSSLNAISDTSTSINQCAARLPKLELIKFNEIDPNDPEAQKAATRIQAVFRGHKTRKDMKTDQNDTEEVQDFEAEFRPDDKELCHAATKIQASFRGHKVRKQADEAEKLSKEMEKAKVEEEEILDIDLTDPELNKAATKIQASFRGHKVRKEEGEGEGEGSAEAKAQ